MDKNVSIVRVDTRPYRKIAQENWGLTKEQMKGKHVHHRIARSDGGTNDPSNLYVCSPWFHKTAWHSEDGFNSLIPYASSGGKLGGLIGGKKVHEEKDEKGRSLRALEMHKKVHAEKNEEGKSVNAVKAGEACHAAKDESGRSIRNLNLNEKLHTEKNEEGKSALAVKAGEACHADKDESGRSIRNLLLNQRLHAEKDDEGKSILAVKAAKISASQVWESTEDGFRGNAGAVACHNKARGWDKNARVRIS